MGEILLVMPLATFLAVRAALVGQDERQGDAEWRGSFDFSSDVFLTGARPVFHTPSAWADPLRRGRGHVLDRHPTGPLEMPTRGFGASGQVSGKKSYTGLFHRGRLA